jgi:Flp pilus assembly protein TadD
VYFAMGKILAYQGKKGEAAANFQKVLQLEPGNGRAQRALETLRPD